MTTPSLVSTDWLSERLGDANVRVLDGSYHLPTAKRDAAAEFATAHVPGASYFDIEAISDHSSNLPHMLPSAEAFAEAVSAMGIDNQTHVVVYDAYGLMSAARVWWMFRIFGHDLVSVLDGGFPKWTKESRPTRSGTPSVAARRFKAVLRPELVRTKSDLVANIATGAAQVIDARGRPPGLPARLRNRARAFAAATFPDRRACPSPYCSIRQAALSCRRSNLPASSRPPALMPPNRSWRAAARA